MVSSQEREEIEAVRQLKIQYCYLLDARNVPELVKLFTDDAVCEFVGVFGNPEDGRWEGKARITRGYQEKCADAGDPWTSIHSVTNETIRVDGDTAWGRYYLLDYSMIDKAEDPLALLGLYDEDYRKVDGAWKICRSRIDVLYQLSALRRREAAK